MSAIQVTSIEMYIFTTCYKFEYLNAVVLFNSCIHFEHHGPYFIYHIVVFPFI